MDIQSTYINFICHVITYFLNTKILLIVYSVQNIVLDAVRNSLLKGGGINEEFGTEIHTFC